MFSIWSDSVDRWFPKRQKTTHKRKYQTNKKGQAMEWSNTFGNNYDNENFCSSSATFLSNKGYFIFTPPQRFS